jgi:hypothetical protein
MIVPYGGFDPIVSLTDTTPAQKATLFSETAARLYRME